MILPHRGRGTTPPGRAQRAPEDKLRVVEGAVVRAAPSVRLLAWQLPQWGSILVYRPWSEYRT